MHAINRNLRTRCTAGVMAADVCKVALPSTDLLIQVWNADLSVVGALMSKTGGGRTVRRDRAPDGQTVWSLVRQSVDEAAQRAGAIRLKRACILLLEIILRNCHEVPTQ